MKAVAQPLRGLLVVIPARDEAELLRQCLQSVADAVDALRDSQPQMCAVVVVVADRCLDRTADIARDAGAHVVEVDEGCVGAARRAGVEAGLVLLPSVTPSLTWVASTDADTRVPPDWLTHQLGLAAAGVRLVIGRAVPASHDLPVLAWRRWQDRHLSDAVGAHVHGANLGFRLDDYRAAGGWPRLAEHEDRSLVNALLTAGVPAARGLEVITSGRLSGRTPGGFSGFLRTLVDPLHPEDALEP